MALVTRGLAVALAAVLLLAGPVSSPAAAKEKRCGERGRPPCTILRPPEPAAIAQAADRLGPDCVILVGGFGSTNGDRAFDEMLSWADADHSFQTYHLGFYPRGHPVPYDSTGPIDESAESLTQLIRSLGPSCARVHLVTHSMGGAVADRALAMGLSARDGVATYVSLSGPHNGATVARLLRPYLDLDPLLAFELHEILLDGPDPTSPAGRQLADTPPRRTVRGIDAVRMRLATDPFVLRRDVTDRRVELREFMPDPAPDQIEGHGGVLHTVEVRDAVWWTIAMHRLAPDCRSDIEKKVAAAVSVAVDAAAPALYVSALDFEEREPKARAAMFAAAAGAVVARAILEERERRDEASRHTSSSRGAT